jgi:NAD(P)-dependent dehydrogenase (short-subunit alcohol dehydrogenase family)
VIVGNSDRIGYALTRQLLDDGWTLAGLSRSPGDLRHDRYRRVVAEQRGGRRQVEARAEEGDQGLLAIPGWQAIGGDAALIHAVHHVRPPRRSCHWHPAGERHPQQRGYRTHGPDWSGH